MIFIIRFIGYQIIANIPIKIANIIPIAAAKIPPPIPGPIYEKDIPKKKLKYIKDVIKINLSIFYYLYFF